MPGPLDPNDPMHQLQGLGLSPYFHYTPAPVYQPPVVPSPPERKLVDAFYSAINGLPPSAAALARWLILVGAFPRRLSRMETGAELDLDNPPERIRDSRVVKSLTLKAINNGGLVEIFMVQSLALFVLDSLHKYFPEWIDRIEHVMTYYADRDALVRDWG